MERGSTGIQDSSQQLEEVLEREREGMFAVEDKESSSTNCATYARQDSKMPIRQCTENDISDVALLCARGKT